MHIVNIDQVPKQQHSTPLMTGPGVYAQNLSPEGAQFACRVVTFGKGVRNKFHTHTSDQVLIVTAGRGIVATQQEQREVGVGDVIFFPAGEVHWHGATADSEFAHLYLMLADSQSKQIEP